MTHCRATSRIFLSDTINILPRVSRGGVARYFSKTVDGLVDRLSERVIVCTPETHYYGAAVRLRSVRFRRSYILKRS